MCLNEVDVPRHATVEIIHVLTKHTLIEPDRIQFSAQLMGYPRELRECFKSGVRDR